MQDIRAIPTATMAMVSQILSSLAESVAKLTESAAKGTALRGAVPEVAVRGLVAKGVAAIAGEATLRVKNGAVNAINTPACLKRAAMLCIFPP
jgi:nitrous oxidase accessory protein NosD